MDKRGQFFLIAALVIAGIIITFGIINITTRAPAEDVAIYDLSNEIGYESGQLIDRGVYMSLSPGQLSSQVISLIGNYSASNPDTDITVVYGDAANITAVSYENVPSGSEGVNIGGTTSQVLQTRRTIQSHRASVNPSGNITVRLNDTESLSFDLKQGENFYLILKKNVKGERLVAQR